MAKKKESYTGPILLALAVAIIMTAGGHWFGIHNGLEHMQFGDQYWLYGLEVVFYWGFWLLLGSWFFDSRNNVEREQAFYREKGEAILERARERERDHQVLIRNGFVWAEQNMSLSQVDW